MPHYDVYSLKYHIYPVQSHQNWKRQIFASLHIYISICQHGINSN
nr:MAG TPA: hypothetical protein [Caudoviricetes sp.]